MDEDGKWYGVVFPDTYDYELEDRLYDEWVEEDK